MLKKLKQAGRAIINFFKKGSTSSSSSNTSSSTPKPVVIAPTDTNEFSFDKALKLAMSITGTFEGKGYGQVTGNFDGQTMSCGFAQWNFGQGSLLNSILYPFYETHGADKLKKHFPENFVNLVIAKNNKGLTSYAHTNMLTGTSVKPSWVSVWTAFLTSPECVSIQLEAMRSLAIKAYNYCSQYSCVSYKSFCFMFDIVVQNGSLKTVGKPDTSDTTKLKSEYQAYLRELPPKCRDTVSAVSANIETMMLSVWAGRRAVRNDYRKDVLSRKLTIAHGTGIVHGKLIEVDYESLIVRIH